MHIFKDTNFDFLRWRWHAIALSSVVVIAGIVLLVVKGIPLGVEFAGGTVVVEQFDRPVSVDQVRQALSQNYPDGGNATIQAYGDPSLNQVMIRVPHVGEESGQAIGTSAAQVEEALRKDSSLGGFHREGAEIVGPAVGRELTQQGSWAMGLSLVGILGYIAFRYQFSFAVGAVVASIHDLLVTFAFLAFFQYDLTLNVIAAILTVTGYSTNDTIVIFDRVRENLRGMRRDSLNHVINVALNQTLGRTVLTAGTAFLSSLALFLFGGDVLRGFAFTMMVGIITGTYSSVFVAAAIVTMWRGKSPTRAAANAPGVSPAAPQQPQRRAKPQKKARAS